MLIIIGGPMFSGKTTWLLNYLSGLPKNSYRLFKPAIDNRYSETDCVTHDGHTSPADKLDISNPRLPTMDKSIKTVLIDELNFFSANLIPEVRRQLESGRTVVGAGLIYDYRRLPFGATLELSRMAERFEQLYAICDFCHKTAEESYRKVRKKGQVLVGAGESYGACCSRCRQEKKL